MDVELRELLMKYVGFEVRDSLEYEANSNDIDGIVENIFHDIDDRICEYLDFIKKDEEVL